MTEEENDSIKNISDELFEAEMKMDDENEDAFIEAAKK